MSKGTPASEILKMFKNGNMLPVDAQDQGVFVSTNVLPAGTLGPIGNSGPIGPVGMPGITGSFLSNDELLDTFLLLIDSEVITAKKAMNIRSMLRSSDTETVNVAETLLKKLRIDNLK